MPPSRVKGGVCTPKQNDFYIFKSCTIRLGTAKGNLILYNHKIGRKMPILGKHSRKIICGCWSLDSNLALGGGDDSLTVSYLHFNCFLSF